MFARIIDFNLTDSFDYLDFNGARYTGNNPTENITSSFEIVYVQFVVQSGTAKGFLIELSAVNVTGKSISLSSSRHKWSDFINSKKKKYTELLKRFYVLRYRIKTALIQRNYLIFWHNHSCISSVA